MNTQATLTEPASKQGPQMIDSWNVAREISRLEARLPRQAGSLSSDTLLQTRREFLRGTVRSTLLWTVAFMGLVLFRRQLNCTTQGGCGGCRLSEDCVLPWKEAK